VSDSLWQLQARTSDSGVIRQTRWSRAVLLLIQKMPLLISSIKTSDKLQQDMAEFI